MMTNSGSKHVFQEWEQSLKCREKTNIFRRVVEWEKLGNEEVMTLWHWLPPSVHRVGHCFSFLVSELPKFIIYRQLIAGYALPPFKPWASKGFFPEGAIVYFARCIQTYFSMGGQSDEIFILPTRNKENDLFWQTLNRKNIEFQNPGEAKASLLPPPIPMPMLQTGFKSLQFTTYDWERHPEDDHQTSCWPSRWLSGSLFVFYF